MKKIIYILTIVILTACQTNNENNKRTSNDDKSKHLLKDTNNSKQDFPEVKDELTAYLENFKKADLPIKIKGCQVNTNGLVEFDGKRFKKFNEYYSYAYRQIPTNGNYIATITLGVADCFQPVLTTYKPNGDIIDSKTIAIGYCGIDCGYSCEEFMSIDKNYEIYVSDTISSYECDSIGNEIPGTYEYYVIYKEGKLLTEGKIQLTDEIKKNLEGRKNEP
jgi:hypothetical protein